MPTTWKTVRVFISSTFRDMQAERDHLVRFVFPRLREQLVPRRIHLVDVDLRWGVTSEQDASEVCREIITECRPRFLCMLGGRYGTIPEGRELSITADEVHFGVLDADREKLYGLFYFRHGAVTEKMDESSPGFIREPRHSEKAAKLARLKRGIRRAKCKPFLYRPRWNADEQRLLDLKAFGDRVARDILATIDDEFGIQLPAQLDEFADENAAMEAFVEECRERFVLGSRGAVLEELLAHASETGGDGYVCLTGAPGSGKSALLAHLSGQSTLNSQPSTLLIRHFVGASPGSTDVRRTLRRLCHELKEGCPDITADIPDDPEKLRAAFPDFLQQACASKRVVILLDAVNQFDPAWHSAGLHWLPAELPEGARVILSALDGPALEELRRQCKPREIELKALTADDGEAIIEQFRTRYHKTFEPDQRAALVAKTDAGTPLYLLAALEELRTLGTYEEITRRIAELPPTTRELFAWILKRLEHDDGFRNASGQLVGRELVSSFAVLLGASRHGLSQRELADLLDGGDPQGNVAALLHLLHPYLMRRGELLDFYHGQFRTAAEEAWLKTDAQRQAAHAQLADYFWRFRRTERAVTELPWQLRRAGQMGRFKDYLVDPDVLQWFLASGHEYELWAFWREFGGGYDIAGAYETALAPYEKAGILDEFLAPSLSRIASFLITIGRYEDALRLSQRVADSTMRTPGEANAAISLNNLGLVLLQLGDFRAAEPLIGRALQMLEAIDGPDHLSVARVVDNLAWALREKGDYDGAERLYRRGLEIHERTLGRDHLDTAQSLNNLSCVLSAREDYAGAECLLRRALAIRRATLGNNHPATATTLVNMAVVLSAQGLFRETAEVSKEALVIMDKTLGPDHPVTAKTRALIRGIPPSGDAAR